MIIWIIITTVLALVFIGGPLWLAITIHRLTRAARADGVAATHLEVLGLMLRHDYPNGHRRRRGGPPLPTARNLLDSARRASLAGLGVTLREIETHALAGGDPALCLDAMIEARSRGLAPGWMTIVVIDLSGRDPLAAAEAGANLNRVIGSPKYEGMFSKAATCAH